MLYDPRFFGVRPHLVVKGGVIAWGAMGDANASIPTPQPVLPRPMFGAYGRTAGHTSIAFVSQAAVDDGLAEKLELAHRVVAVDNTRGVAKADMVNNDALPDIEVDPETFAITVEGEPVTPSPATTLPLAQLYSMF